jgi:hypothetical protein
MLTYTFEECRNLADTLLDVKETFYTFKQSKQMYMQRYHDSFLAHVEVMKAVSATIADASLVQEKAQRSNQPGALTKNDQDTIDK